MSIVIQSKHVHACVLCCAGILALLKSLEIAKNVVTGSIPDGAELLRSQSHVLRSCMRTHEHFRCSAQMYCTETCYYPCPSLHRLAACAASAEACGTPQPLPHFPH